MIDARRIAVVTSTRADYGLLRWTMQSLKDDPRAQLQVIATGTHLSSAVGTPSSIASAKGACARHPSSAMTLSSACRTASSIS